jgi:hypothetical protein
VLPNVAGGEPIAVIERGVMRPLGLITQAVHLSGWSEDGKLWVARRSLTKATDPGMWDTLVGGLVSAGRARPRARIRRRGWTRPDRHSVSHPSA